MANPILPAFPTRARISIPPSVKHIYLEALVPERAQLDDELSLREREITMLKRKITILEMENSALGRENAQQEHTIERFERKVARREKVRRRDTAFACAVSGGGSVVAGDIASDATSIGGIIHRDFFIDSWVGVSIGHVIRQCEARDLFLFIIRSAIVDFISHVATAGHPIVPAE